MHDGEFYVSQFSAMVLKLEINVMENKPPLQLISPCHAKTKKYPHAHTHTRIYTLSMLGLKNLICAVHVVQYEMLAVDDCRFCEFASSS